MRERWSGEGSGTGVEKRGEEERMGVKNGEKRDEREAD